jgi:hypothetical protein
MNIHRKVNILRVWYLSKSKPQILHKLKANVNNLSNVICKHTIKCTKINLFLNLFEFRESNAHIITT